MKVLFVCRGNVGRSQMAEAFFNSKTSNHKAVSAGTHSLNLDGRVSYAGDRIEYIAPNISRCMKDKGIDISNKISKQLCKYTSDSADLIVWITDRDSVPDYLKYREIIYWDVKDAVGTSYEKHCLVRDKIKILVDKLILDLG
jgi:protein-tyrosine-phosphatase